MNVTITRVDISREDVWNRIRALHEKCFPHDNPYPPRDVGGAWWIVRANGKEVAFAGVTSGSSPNTAYLCRCGVLSEYRGWGIQKKLIRVRVRYARRAGYHTVVTDTRHNPPSANSLISCKFKCYSPANPWATKDAIYWRLQLQE